MDSVTLAISHVSMVFTFVLEGIKNNVSYGISNIYSSFLYPRLILNHFLNGNQFKHCFYSGLIDNSMVLKVDCSPIFELMKEINREPNGKEYLFLHDINNNLGIIDKCLYTDKEIEDILVNYYKYISKSSISTRLTDKCSPLQVEFQDDLFINNLYIFAPNHITYDYISTLNILWSILNNNLIVSDYLWYLKTNYISEFETLVAEKS